MFHGLDAGGVLRRLLVDTSRRLVVVLEAGAALIGRVDARNGDKVFSFSAVYAGVATNLNAAAGGNTLNLAGTPANTIRHVTSIGAQDANTNPTRIVMFAGFSGVSSHVLKDMAGPGAGVFGTWDGHIILRPGDYIFVTFSGCALNDDITVRACGWDESI